MTTQINGGTARVVEPSTFDINSAHAEMFNVERSMVMRLDDIENEFIGLMSYKAAPSCTEFIARQIGLGLRLVHKTMSGFRKKTSTSEPVEI